MLYKVFFCSKVKQIFFICFTETRMFTMLYKAFLCFRVKQICCFLSGKHFDGLVVL